MTRGEPGCRSGGGPGGGGTLGGKTLAGSHAGGGPGGGGTLGGRTLGGTTNEALVVCAEVDAGAGEGAFTQRYQRRRRTQLSAVFSLLHPVRLVNPRTQYCQPPSPKPELARQGSAFHPGGSGKLASSKDQKHRPFASAHLPGSVGNK